MTFLLLRKGEMLSDLPVSEIGFSTFPVPASRPIHTSPPRTPSFGWVLGSSVWVLDKLGKSGLGLKEL